MRANALASFEHPQSTILEIIRAALCAAALAPWDRVALDVAGEALRRLAEIARDGGCHA